MPLGVEHSVAGKLVRPRAKVPLPLMPLGVEHYTVEDLEWDKIGAFTFDAFRR